MTKSELKRYNGKEGAKAYIAFKGLVYDVTDSPCGLMENMREFIVQD